MLEVTKAPKLLAACMALLAICHTIAWSKPSSKPPNKPSSKHPARINVPIVIKQIIELSNKHRQEAGLCVLTEHPVLNEVAYGHSAEMAAKEYFDHESPVPSRRWPWDRVNLVGMDSEAFGENLHLIEGWPPDETAPRVVDAWMRSPHHRENLLSPKFNHVGIGIATIGAQIYVTQLLSHELQPFVPTP